MAASARDGQQFLPQPEEPITLTDFETPRYVMLMQANLAYGMVVNQINIAQQFLAHTQQQLAMLQQQSAEAQQQLNAYAEDQASLERNITAQREQLESNEARRKDSESLIEKIIRDKAELEKQIVPLREAEQTAARNRDAAQRELEKIKTEMEKLLAARTAGQTALSASEKQNDVAKAELARLRQAIAAEANQLKESRRQNERERESAAEEKTRMRDELAVVKSELKAAKLEQKRIANERKEIEDEKREAERQRKADARKEKRAAAKAEKEELAIVQRIATMPAPLSPSEAPVTTENPVVAEAPVAVPLEPALAARDKVRIVDDALLRDESYYAVVDPFPLPRMNADELAVARESYRQFADSHGLELHHFQDILRKEPLLAKEYLIFALEDLTQHNPRPGVWGLFQLAGRAAIQYDQYEHVRFLLLTTSAKIDNDVFHHISPRNLGPILAILEMKSQSLLDSIKKHSVRHPDITPAHIDFRNTVLRLYKHTEKHTDSFRLQPDLNDPDQRFIEWGLLQAVRSDNIAKYWRLLPHYLGEQNMLLERAVYFQSQLILSDILNNTPPDKLYDCFQYQNDGESLEALTHRTWPLGKEVLEKGRARISLLNPIRKGDYTQFKLQLKNHGKNLLSTDLRFYAELAREHGQYNMEAMLKMREKELAAALETRLSAAVDRSRGIHNGWGLHEGYAGPAAAADAGSSAKPDGVRYNNKSR